MIMKIFDRFPLIIATCGLLLSSTVVHAQTTCADETAALETCLETAGLSGLGLTACNSCVNTAGLSGAFLPTCNGVKSATCLAIEGCTVLCSSAACRAEIGLKVQCDVNDTRGADRQCSGLTECDDDDDDDGADAAPDDGGSDTSTITSPGDTSAAPPDMSTPTDTDTDMSPCSTESTTLSTCLMDSAGLDEEAQMACLACLNTGALPASFLPTCSGVVSASCLAIQACDLACRPDTSLTDCADAAISFVQCQVNEDRSDNGGPCDLTCSTGDDGDGDDTSPSACADETTALDTCLEASTNGPANDRAKGLCDACVASASTVAALLPGCQQVVPATCTALRGCEQLCGADCPTQMSSKVLCEINESRSEDCDALDCSDDSGGDGGDGGDGDDTGSDGACAAETTALDACLAASNTGPGDDWKSVCDTCVGAASAVPALLPGGCDLAVVPAACAALQGCETAACGTTDCTDEMTAKVLCDLNQARSPGSECESLVCTSDGGGEDGERGGGDGGGGGSSAADMFGWNHLVISSAATAVLMALVI